MEYVRDNWGSFVSVVSLIITVIMVGIAIWRTGQAQKSAKAAEAASSETKAALTRTLAIVDLERAIGLIQRLKSFHTAGRWEASSQHYQLLRVMLGDIDTT